MTSGRLFFCGAGSSPLRGRSLLPAAWSEAPSIILLFHSPQRLQQCGCKLVVFGDLGVRKTCSD